MSELKTNLEQILQEKNEKIISQNIKKDVEVLGVTGSYDKEDIKVLQDELADAEQELADVRRDLDNSTVTISGSGENVTLNGTAEARFKKAPLPLGNTEQEVIEAQAGTIVEGENISASGVDLSKVEILNINGNTKQEATTGKNLIPTNNSEWEQGTIQPAGGTESDSTTRIRTKEYYPISAGNHYISIRDTNYTWLNLLYYDNNYEFKTAQSSISSISGSRNSLITVPNDTAYYKATIKKSDDSTIEASEVNLIKPMIEQGSTKTDFEIYTGGIASPNPDYPQEMHSVGANINLLDISQVMIGKAWNNASNSARAVVYMKCDPSTTYTISFNNISSFDGVYNFEKTSPEDTTAIVGVSQITTTKTITTNANSSYLGIQFNKSSISAGDFVGLKIKIEKGDKATAYSEYGQGCASVVVENKNKLAYPDISSVTFGNVTFAHDKGIYTISTDGTSTTPTSTDVYPIENYTIQEGDYIHYNNSFIDSHIGISLRFSDNTNVFNSFASSTNRIISLSNYVGKTITAIGFNWNTGYTFTGTCKPMITNSSTATTYVAHEEQSFTIPTQAPFRKIGNYKDTFVKKVDGKWHEKHKIGEVILDGSELTWSLASSKDDYYEFQGNNVLNPVAVSGYTFPVSSYFSNLTNNRVVANAHLVLIRVPSTSNITTVQNWKAWLSTHNLIVNYALAEPTYIECTQEQSQILDQINTFYETTNIFSTDEVSPNFTFTYNKVYASPSPDDESLIQTVSGDVEVKAQSKNLFGMSENKTNSNHNVDFSVVSNRYIINGTSSSDNTGYKAIDLTTFRIDNYGNYIINRGVKKLPAGTYTFSVQNITGSVTGSTDLMSFGVRKESNIASERTYIAQLKISEILNNVKSKTFTLTEDTEMYFVFAYRMTNAVFSSYSFNIQLEEGSTSTTYTPHQEQVLPLSLKSKNLFDGLFEIGTIDNSGVKQNSTTAIRTVNFISINPNTQYILSSEAIQIRSVFYDENYQFVGTHGASFTSRENEYYMKFVLSSTDLQTKAQLEEGSTETSYEPCYNYELCKIGDYQDYFWKDETTNKWYLHKEINKHVFTGAETWYKANDNINVYVTNLSQLDKLSGNNSNFICNYFKYLGDAQTQILGNCMSFNSGEAYRNSCYIQCDTFIAQSNVELKNYVKGLYDNQTPILVYSVLKTQTDTEITGTTLISQLEAIRKAISYDEQTNVSSNTIALFDIIALRNMNTILNTLENDVDLLE